MEVKHGMCGNGIRCLARYLYEEGFINKKKFVIETISGNKEIELIVENKTVIGVKVDMGEVVADGEEEIELDSITLKGYKMLTGNPHFVCFRESLYVQELEKYGSIIENYKYFPEKTNVEFVKILSFSRVQMLVWERGVRKNAILWYRCMCSKCGSKLI